MLKQELEHLYSLKKFDFKGKPSLKQIEKALEKLGNFHKKLRVIHITRTNGKGSTAAMTTEILKQAGYKTGLFTSPHLIRYNERIQINRKEITDEELLEYINKVRSLDVELSFFEFTTTLALKYFFDKNVDFIVLEVGLGGTYDATNICDAEIAAITDISPDHTNVLGKTIKEIAEDKCGIIKERSTVITDKNNKALDVIKEKSKNNKLVIAEEYEGTIRLKGEFQRRNAGIAYSIGKELGVQEEIIKQAIEKTEWPGRLEFLEKNVLADCAHNPFAISEITKFVKKLNYKRLIIIFGVLERKDFRKMIKKLPKPDFLILTRPNIDKALDPAKLAHEGQCAVVESPKAALSFAKAIAKEKDLILITGSCYLVGNVKAIYPKNKKLAHKFKN